VPQIGDVPAFAYSASCFDFAPWVIAGLVIGLLGIFVARAMMKTKGGGAA